MRDSQSEELLKRLQQGDESALTELAQQFGSKIYQLAFRYLRNHEDAEEITQDVLYKVFRKVGEFRGDAALSSWIYRITFNSAMSRLRSASYQRAQDEQREPVPVEGDDTTLTAAQEVADWSNMADEHLLRSQLRRRLVRAVLALRRSAPGAGRAAGSSRMSTGSERNARVKIRRSSRACIAGDHPRKQLADFAGGLTLHRPIFGT